VTRHLDHHTTDSISRQFLWRGSGIKQCLLAPQGCSHGGGGAPAPVLSWSSSSRACHCVVRHWLKPWLPLPCPPLQYCFWRRKPPKKAAVLPCRVQQQRWAPLLEQQSTPVLL